MWTRAAVVAWAAFGGAGLSPEVQLCLQHFRPGERARAEAALGPLDQIPLYRVELDVQPRTRRVRGHVRVDYPVTAAPLAALYLRVTPNAFGEEREQLSGVTVDGQSAPCERAEAGLCRVALNPPKPPGSTVVAELAFAAEVPQAAPGADTLINTLAAGPAQDDHGAFSAFEDAVSLVGVVPRVPPLDGRGEPTQGPTGVGDLALYAPANVLAAVTVPAGYRALCTGEAMGEVPQKDGRVRFSFSAAAVRDFPVLAVRGYEEETAAVDDLTVEASFQGAHRKAGRRMLEYAAAAVSEFQKRLGPLPYKRLRVVEMPLSGGAGGMEFPGLITVSTGLLEGTTDPLQALLGDQAAALGPLMAQFKQMGAFETLSHTLGNLLEFTVAHEVAHQYFAGLVGSDPIHEPVVDEALAQEAALLYVEWRHGKKAAANVRQEQLAAAYHLYRLSGGRDGPADRPTSGFSGPLEYAALVYGKGPLLHEAERHLLGDAAFLRGLKGYVDAYRYRWSCRQCLTRVLAKENPDHAAELEALRRRWWLEAHGDEDLGGADLGGLAGAGGNLDPQTEALMRQILQQLGGP